MLEDDYAVAYAAQARVYHSHNYTCMQQFKRYFDLAVSQTEHPEVFGGLASEGEGIRLVKKTAAYLLKKGRPWLIPGMIVQSGFKYMGYRAGKCWRVLPGSLVRRWTSNPEYWKKKGREEK